jgi:hypothetical protein
MLQWATFVAALAVAVIYVVQSHLMNQARKGANLLELVRLLQEPAMRAAREAVYELRLAPEELEDDAHKSQREHVEQVAQLLNTAAWMFRHRMIPRGAFLRNWDWVISKSWVHTREWTLHRRARSFDVPYLSCDFEWLARRSDRHIRRRGYRPPSLDGGIGATG